jgi:hygromycin-B 7''-O-kinase
LILLPDLSLLDSPDGYRQHFMDLALWQPHVQAICHRHNLEPCQPIRAGLAGTYPTFIVEDRWVVKLFGQLFDGGQAYQTEAQVGCLLPPDLPLPTPGILYTGTLYEGNVAWNWPYLIFEYIHGQSIGEVYQQVSFDDKLMLACRLGETTRQIQRVFLDGAAFFHAGREAYLLFLQSQREHCRARHAGWRSLPGPLLDQIDAYVLPSGDLADDRFPCGLIHADLTRDHILGRLEAGRWISHGLIDFGDARVGNVFYELAALHLDLFLYDKRLLHTYLEAYGLAYDPQFPRLAMSAALLHQFNVFEGLLEALPEAQHAHGLDELAHMIWAL